MSLSIKLYILIAVIILVLSIMFEATSFYVYCKKVDDFYFSQTLRAAEAATAIPTPYINYLRDNINTDEFRKVRDEALAANDETIIIKWMGAIPSYYPEDLTEKQLSEEEIVQFNSLYGDYLQMVNLCERNMELFDEADIYYQYMENGITYNLVDPNENLFNIGSVEPPIEEFAGYGDNERVLPTVYHSKWGWLCTACEPIEEYNTGEAIALACADTDMNEVMAERDEFFFESVVFILVELAIAIVISMFLMRRSVTKPLQMLAKAATDFAGGDESLTKDDVIQLPIRSNDEIGELYHEIQSMQNRIVDYTENITRITAARERVDSELRMAKDIQTSAIPKEFPAFPDRDEFELYACMEPAKIVGGDFYDFFLIDDDHLCLVIADVSDKGVPAALFMMSAKNLINYRVGEGGTPSEILKSVNDQLCKNNASMMFVTVWLGILEISSGKMICSNAAHEYPFVRGKDGTFKKLSDKHCLMLGTVKKAQYSDYEILMEPGDAVFVYTDGVPEARNEKNEFYGMERLEEALNIEASAAPKKILENVLKANEQFVGGADQSDDLTMLCIEYRK